RSRPASSTRLRARDLAESRAHLAEELAPVDAELLREPMVALERRPRDAEQADERLRDAEPAYRDGLVDGLLPAARGLLDLAVGARVGEVPLVELDHQRHAREVEPVVLQVLP